MSKCVSDACHCFLHVSFAVIVHVRSPSHRQGFLTSSAPFNAIHENNLPEAPYTLTFTFNRMDGRETRNNSPVQSEADQGHTLPFVSQFKHGSRRYAMCDLTVERTPRIDRSQSSIPKIFPRHSFWIDIVR